MDSSLGTTRPTLRESLLIAFGVLLCLVVSCSDDSLSVDVPRDVLHLRYYDANVGSANAADYPPIEEGDTLYSVLPWGSDGMVLFILWPPPDPMCNEHLGLSAVIVGSAELTIGLNQICEVDTLGADSVSYSCDLGANLGFSISTVRSDTSVVLDLTFRVCCEKGGCLPWSEPISFTVIDTLSRSP
jgi:hypothetical protein